MPDVKVLVVGSMNADLTTTVGGFPSPGETVLGTDLRTEPGGKSSNQAAAAALLGADVALVGVVGADELGDRLIIEAAAKGVDTSRVRRSPDKSTGAAMIAVNHDGENTIIVSPGANATLAPADLPDADLEGAPIVAMALEVPLETVISVAERAASAGAHVLLNASPMQALPAQLLANVEVLIINEGEMLALLGEQDLAQGWDYYARKILGLGPTCAIVTRGKSGAVVFEPGEPAPAVTSIDAVQVTAVDTTGCGDAFMGAIAAELAAGLPLVEAAKTGALAGAWAAQNRGAQASYGRHSDLQTFLWEARPQP
ncbi:ribokinase [Pseudarthrobacter sp. NamE5]|uniref:ribokinase n=1 Tax=Pseudarthrobacter sp. NamE5 TaxID=2576839 RepID=UPI00110A4F42|nr:ribokinase [Pseudarthrobacter sp. NamE5]TLM80757.1 ribokinase [Pseudarthrobacter sp. NamE5]